MKRYKVVQDANRHWGILDTRKWLLDKDFASWGEGSYTGADYLEEIVSWAAKLNQGTSEPDWYEWTYYKPRKENR